MSYHNDIPDVQISATHFQEFDHSKPVLVNIPEHYKVKVGDKVNWEYAQFYGIAVIAERVGERCKLEKVS